MALLVPNLSGLKLKDEEEDTGAVQGERPNLALGKRGRDYEGWYEQELFGEKALQAVGASIENNEVLTSYRPSPMYETFSPGGMAFHTVKWWFDWQHFALSGQTAIGSGSHNSAYLVPHGPDLPFLMLYGGDGYNMDINRVARGLIVRIGKVVKTAKDKHDPPRKASHINEMITAAYAHAHGIGPVIFAQFYLGSEASFSKAEKAATKGVEWDAPVLQFADPNPKPVKLANFAYFTCTIAEAWDGDCVRKISSSLTHVQFDPEAFANEFVRLCALAADAGFWHMDIKRANLLYRAAPTATDPYAIELTFTDFDSHFCRILAPDLRPHTRHCCIAATAACFLGEIRCQSGYDTWARFAGPIREAMKALADPVDIERIKPWEWCFFLREVGESREVTTRDGTISVIRDEGSAQQRDLGYRFRNHLNNYFYRVGAKRVLNDRCFKLDPSLPLFPQVVTYALGPLP